MAFNISYPAFEDTGETEEEIQRRRRERAQRMLEIGMANRGPQTPTRAAPGNMIGGYDAPPVDRQGRELLQPANDQMGGFFGQVGGAMNALDKAGIGTSGQAGLHNAKWRAEVGPWWKQFFFGGRR
jgi:hypothetical protein